MQNGKSFVVFLVGKLSDNTTIYNECHECSKILRHINPNGCGEFKGSSLARTYKLLGLQLRQIETH